jgi:uncharacterized membrane protein YecN with MAPEG domain
MTISSLYTARLGLLFVTLSIRTLRTRLALSIAIGDASNPKNLRAARVHANFAEHVPFSLPLIYCIGAPNTLC